MHETEKERAERLHQERIGHLRFALNKRDRLQRELNETDEYINSEAKNYWKHLGYSVMPRIERLRAAIPSIKGLGTVEASRR